MFGGKVDCPEDHDRHRILDAADVNDTYLHQLGRGLHHCIFPAHDNVRP